MKNNSTLTYTSNFNRRVYRPNLVWLQSFRTMVIQFYTRVCNGFVTKNFSCGMHVKTIIGREKCLQQEKNILQRFTETCVIISKLIILMLMTIKWLLFGKLKLALVNNTEHSVARHTGHLPRLLFRGSSLLMNVWLS